MTHKFEPGDVVQAVVGGRQMTVTRYDDRGNVVCRWFVGNDLDQATFTEAVLKKVGESCPSA